MQKPVPPTDSTLSLDQLRERFPGVHSLFVESPEFTPPKPGPISCDLVHFLRAYGFDIHISWTPPGRKNSTNKKPVRYGTILIIKGRTIGLGDRDFLSYEVAQQYVLDHALDIFEQELKITA